MRKVTEERYCDRCKKVLYKDGPHWMGGSVVVRKIIPTDTTYVGSEMEYDLCRHCIEGITGWMNAT